MAVVGTCDKPIVFFQSKDKVEMQYLASGQISKLQQFGGKLVYLDSRHELQIGQLDDLQKLQTQRMHFKKQITRSQLIPKFD